MNHIYSKVLLFCVSLFIVSCGSQNAQTNIQLDAKTKEYFAELQAQHIDKVLGFYSKEFFNIQPKQMWQSRLNSLFEKFGPIERISFINKQADTRFSGKFFIYQYYTIHGKKRVKHVLIWILPVDGVEIELVGHMIKEPRGS